MQDVLDTVQTDDSQVQSTETEIQEEKVEGETPAKSEEPKSEEMPKGVLKKINKQTAIIYSLKEKLRQEQLKNQDLNKKPEFPNPKQFEDEYGNLKQKDWSDAVSTYEDMKDNWKTAQSSVKQDEEKFNVELEQGRVRFLTQGAKMAENNPDFFQIVSQQNTYSVPLGNTLFTMENGHELAYYLGKHKDEALRIGRLDPEAMVDELEALEQRMKVQPRTVSQASPPISPIDGGNTDVKDVSSIVDDDAWIKARRREQEKKFRKG